MRLSDISRNIRVSSGPQHPVVGLDKIFNENDDGFPGGGAVESR